MSFESKKNVYMCHACGQGFVSLDVDKGTTPFITTCLNPSCGKRAHSFCYRAPQDLLKDIKPALEWYMPEESELLMLSPMVQQHVKQGGLISRRTGEKA